MSTHDEFTYGELRWEIQDATLLDLADKLVEVHQVVGKLPGAELITRVKYHNESGTLVVKF